MKTTTDALNIEKALDDVMKALFEECEKRAYSKAYAAGYFMSYMNRVLTAYVPANQRARLVETLYKEAENIRGKE